MVDFVIDVDISGRRRGCKNRITYFSCVFSLMINGWLFLDMFGGSEGFIEKLDFMSLSTFTPE